MVRKLFWWSGLPALAVAALLTAPGDSWARGGGSGAGGYAGYGGGNYRGFSGGFYSGPGYHDVYRYGGGYGYHRDYDFYRRGYYSYYPGYTYYPGYSNWGYNYSTPRYDYSYTGPSAGYRSSYYAPQANQDRVNFNVRVPENAEVWFEGAKTNQTGTMREFVSPPLEPGQTYTYDLRVRYPQGNGRMFDRTEHVPVHAGDRLNLDFTRPEMQTSESKRPSDQSEEHLTNPPRERSNQSAPRSERSKQKNDQ